MKIKVVVKKVGCFPSVESMENSLESMQSIVDGYIEVVPIFDDVYLVCNEEGKLMGLEPNFNITYGSYNMSDTVCGNCFFTADDGEGDFRSLTEEEVEKVWNLF